jgi:heme iron utilization protein
MTDAKLSRPTHAETARTLLAQSGHGVLSTNDANGFPYASLVDIVPLENGNALLLLSDLAEHTQNAKRNAKVSLLLAEDWISEQKLAKARVNLFGTLTQVDKTAHQKMYLAAQPNAEMYLSFADFHMFALNVERVYVIAGFGRMGWVTQEGYARSEADPLKDASEGILEHMNTDHAHNLIDYAKVYGNLAWADLARMIAIDAYGFDMLVKGSEQHQSLRLAFDTPLKNVDDAHVTLVRMAKEAKVRFASLEEDVMGTQS